MLAKVVFSLRWGKITFWLFNKLTKKNFQLSLKYFLVLSPYQILCLSYYLGKLLSLKYHKNEADINYYKIWLYSAVFYWKIIGVSHWIFSKLTLWKKISLNQRPLRTFIYIFFLILFLHQLPTNDQGQILVGLLSYSLHLLFRPAPRCAATIPVPAPSATAGDGAAQRGAWSSRPCHVLMEGSSSSGKLSAFQKGKS